jgi:ABC-type transport system involved in multi-copper enzyme maturation permease subunit
VGGGPPLWAPHPAPADGGPEGPSSPYLVRLEFFAFPWTDKPRLTADQAVAQVRDRFGKFRDATLATVEDVRVVEGPPRVTTDGGPQAYLTLEVKARPTSKLLPLWGHRFSLFFGGLPFGEASVPLGFQLWIIEDQIICGFGAWVGVLVGLILTAFFIPNMMRKGTVDLLIVKPISRPTLLVYKYIGGLTFVFVNTAVAVGGIWLALSLRSGLWSPTFLITIFTITFFFAVLYGVSTLFAVMTQSPIVAILISCGAWFLFWLVGVGYFQAEVSRSVDEGSFGQGRRRAANRAEAQRPKEEAPGEKEKQEKEKRPERQATASTDTSDRWYNGWFGKTIYAVHAVLPRTKDLDVLTQRMLLSDLALGGLVPLDRIGPYKSYSWAQSIAVCVAYLVGLLALSCWIFARRDF